MQSPYYIETSPFMNMYKEQSSTKSALTKLG